MLHLDLLTLIRLRSLLGQIILVLLYRLVLLVFSLLIVEIVRNRSIESGLVKAGVVLKFDR